MRCLLGKLMGWCSMERKRWIRFRALELTRDGLTKEMEEYDDESE